ncbi:MAG: hypothetical protein HYX41_01235 [Bdellovibrio sp.]|nr:hypothetical protein [Bdellovibrio sp.]
MKLTRTNSSTHLLNRILAEPDLPQRIQSLSSQGLFQLVREVGLEDCGEILALATTEQIEKVFDEDLWHASKPGSDEAFDSERFGVWLDVLLEIGAKNGAEKLLEMDADFLTMAVSDLVWVIEFHSLEKEVSSESRLEKIMDSTNYFELEDFLIFSKTARFWDSLTTLLAELDQNHHSFLRSLLERCAHLTQEQIHEEGDFFTVLTSEEKLRQDVAYEREKRRQAQGYVAPADARAFLKLASGPLEAEDHVSPKKFHLSPVERLKNHPALPEPSKSGAMENARTSLVASQGSKYKKVEAFFSLNPKEHQIQTEELTYLANVLVAGLEAKERPPRPGEALVMVLETCEKGLGLKTDCQSFIEAFRAGWRK